MEGLYELEPGTAILLSKMLSVDIQRDSKVVVSMRSWSILQPCRSFCVECGTRPAAERLYARIVQDHRFLCQTQAGEAAITWPTASPDSDDDGEFSEGWIHP